MNIMIVDDELISRKKLSIILQAYGDCTEFPSGSDAIDYYQTASEEGHAIDLITLDIDMPDMSGIETLKKIRSIQKELDIPKKTLPIIFMVTSMNDQQNLMDSLSQGCSDYIVKPFDEKKILEKLNNHNII